MNLNNLTYFDAYAHLEASGWTWLADGDWSRVFTSPDGTRVVRVTPFDPAYRLFAETCRMSPHPNLPRYHAIVPLAGCGYAVEMAWYQRGNETESAAFLAALKTRLMADAAEDDALTALLRRGLHIGTDTIPYFGGLDDNPYNVLYDGATPVLVDGFFQEGGLITEGIAAGDCKLAPSEIEAFLQIPYHQRPVDG